ncbi:MAG: 7-cyano-7-deazaguanine synthase QueC [Rhodospirillales bacterium]|nr:7-cyano-7-deazaguanine synthase QueC [Rhodospirillales bacterium]
MPKPTTAGKPAVVLLSGGLDSATTLAIAKAQGYAACALSFRYGQRHVIEVERAGEIARALGAVRHAVVEFDLRQFGGSALTGATEVPKGRSAAEIGRGIPPTYVPARNTIFLAFALGWAETLGAGDIFIGANALDYSGYPDCRPEFIAAFERLANLATKAGVEGMRKFAIHAPLIALTKAEIVRKGLALGIDFAATSSCYDPDPAGKPCGACDSCRLRAKGFAEAGIEDPLLAKFGVGRG